MLLVIVNACAIINSNWPYVYALGGSRIAGDKLWWSFKRRESLRVCGRVGMKATDGNSTTAADEAVSSSSPLSFIFNPTSSWFIPNTQKSSFLTHFSQLIQTFRFCGMQLFTIYFSLSHEFLYGKPCAWWRRNICTEREKRTKRTKHRWMKVSV